MPSAPIAVHGLEPEAESEPGGRVERPDLVRRHQRDGARRENTHAVERAAVADHLEKARVVAGGREQPGAAGEALARPVDVVPLAPGAVRRADDRAVRPARIDRRQAIALRRPAGRTACPSSRAGSVIAPRRTRRAACRTRVRRRSRGCRCCSRRPTLRPAARRTAASPAAPSCRRSPSSLSAVYQPNPAAGPRPLAS